MLKALLVILLLSCHSWAAIALVMRSTVAGNGAVTTPSATVSDTINGGASGNTWSCSVQDTTGNRPPGIWTVAGTTNVGITTAVYTVLDTVAGSTPAVVHKPLGDD